MKIIDARVIVCSPGRNFVTLKVMTDDGLHGLGDATLNGRELAVAAYLSEHLIPLLIGRDPRRIEDTWHELYKGAYWRGGPVTMTAIGAIDLALWDLKGKALDTPVYNLLGGAARDGVTVYGHANGIDAEAAVTAAQLFVDMGYRAVRLQCGVPEIGPGYGVGRGEAYYEPAQPGLPDQERWSTEHYLRVAPQLFAAARDALGWGVKLVHDVHHRLTPIEAARLGKAVEPYQLTWLEDPVPAELQEGYRLIRGHTTTPLGSARSSTGSPTRTPSSPSS